MAALIAGGVALVLWHRLGGESRSVAWAEDGDYFLHDRLQLGAVASIGKQYAGYFQLVPRLATNLAVWARPISQYAVTDAAISCCIVGLCCALVALLAREHLRLWPLRLVVSIVPAALPLMPYEIAGNTANLHWFLLWLSPWLFLARPRTWAGAAGLCAVVVLVVMSEIQTALFMPLLLAGVLRRTGAGRPDVVVRSLPLAAAAVLCLIAQAVNAATHPRPSNHFPWWSIGDLTQAYLLQAVGGSFTADVHAVARVVLAGGWGLVVVPALLLFAVIVVGAVAAPWRARLLIVALTLVSLMVWVLSVQFNRWTAWRTLSESEIVALNPVRYAAAASLLLVTAALVAAAVLLQRLLHQGARPRPQLWQWATGTVGGAVVIAVLVVGIIGLTPVPTIRSGGPDWAAQVEAARPRCVADPLSSVYIGAAPNPTVWGTNVPCAAVLHPGE